MYSAAGTFAVGRGMPFCMSLLCRVRIPGCIVFAVLFRPPSDRMRRCGFALTAGIRYPAVRSGVPVRFAALTGRKGALPAGCLFRQAHRCRVPAAMGRFKVVFGGHIAPAVLRLHYGHFAVALRPFRGRTALAEKQKSRPVTSKNATGWLK